MKSVNFIIKIILLYFFIFSSSFSEIINKIDIKGNSRINSETILMFSGLNTGEDVDELKLNEILKNLYETNYFELVNLVLDKGKLTIEVLENPIILNISYEGIKSSSLRENITNNLILKSRSPFNKIFLEQDKILIQNNLKKMGYYFPDIEVSVIDLANNKIDIKYNINIGNKSKINKITFLGNKIYKDNKLKSVIVTEEYKFWKFISGKKYLNDELINLDQRLLKRFYLNKGYYNVNVNSTFAKLTEEDSFELIYNIESGKKYFFNNLSLSLPLDFDQSHFSKLTDIFNNLKGKHYSLSLIEEILDEIDKITVMEEYTSIKASVSSNTYENKIDLNFIVEETDKYIIKRINIFGNDITRENVIRNQLSIDEGDPFNEILYNKSLNNIKSLNFFKSVTGEILNSDDNSKTINLNVEEKPTGEIMAGAGFGTAGVDFIFAIKENNYLGKGISLAAELNAGTDSVKGSINVENPNYNNTDKSVFFTFESLEFNKLSTYGYKTNKSGFAFGTGFEYLDDLFLKLGTSTYFEKIETNSSASVSQKKQAGNYFDTFLKINTFYDKRNQKFQPSDGFKSSYSLDLPVLSEKNTVTNSYSYDLYNELYENNITSLSFSIMNSQSISGEDIKLSERLFIPSRKLRGFVTGKVGPKDGSDFIGGNSYVTLNITSTLPQLLPNSQTTDFILFADLANLWGVDYNDTLDDNKIRSSIGFGVDWFTPIGPLNFSLAQPLTKGKNDITENFRFNIGTTF